MELKMNQIAIPEKIEFNYDELKRELTERTALYASMVYTEDQVKDAKADRARLNALKSALNQARLQKKREYMAPWNVAEAQMNEIIGLVDVPIQAIDSQLKAYDERKKAEKLEAIKQMFGEYDRPEWLRFEQIYNPKWMLAGATEKKVRAELSDRLAQIQMELETLAKLPSFSFEATEVYKSTLDIYKAIAEGDRLADIQKRKAQHEKELKELAQREAEEKLRRAALLNAKEAKAQEAPVVEMAQAPAQPKKMWVRFAAQMTVEQAKELRDFFVSRGIEFNAI